MRQIGRLIAGLVLAASFAGSAQAATCYITEFTGGAPNGVQVAQQPALAEQTVSISGGSLQSNAFSGGTRLIRLHCDGIASFKIATSPTATTLSARIAADQTEYFAVNPGDKIAIISNS